MTAQAPIYRFGLYELRARTRELYKQGVKLRLRPQPTAVLTLLLERAGDVVTREELRERVWMADTFVDFEHGLNTAIKELRGALSDSALEPRYIETIPRLGYRLIVPVEREGPVQAAEVLPVQSAPAAWPGVERRRALAVPVTPRRRWLWTSGVLVLLILVSAGYWVYTRIPTQPPAYSGRIMLAVLPFENLTGDAGQDYFSDGLTEEMISQLGSRDPRRLGVIARTSVMHYKTSHGSLEQVTRDLGVQYVLEGSVRRDAKNIRVSAQLIQTKDQTHVWAQEYDRELAGLFSLQSEISHEIADEIELTLGEHKTAAAHPALSPRNYEAYDLYLKGQYFFNKRTAADLEQAIGYFQRATTKDPDYARAYASLAGCYALLSGYTGQAQTEFMPKARAAALRALQLDENLSEAHTALALIVQTYDWDWQTSENEFRRAIELNPNYATAHHWYAEHLMWLGRFDEALQESERARQLDPLSLIIAADNGAILFFSRDYDAAIKKWRSVLEMDQDFPRAHLIRGALVEKGLFAEALADANRLPIHVPASTTSWQTYIYGRSGRMAEAHHALQELLQLSRRHPVDPMLIAFAYLGLKDNDLALAWLEKAYAQHSTELASLKVNPGFDPLRSDPRFQDLLRRVGLAQ